MVDMLYRFRSNSLKKSTVTAYSSIFWLELLRIEHVVSTIPTSPIFPSIMHDLLSPIWVITQIWVRTYAWFSFFGFFTKNSHVFFLAIQRCYLDFYYITPYFRLGTKRNKSLLVQKSKPCFQEDRKKLKSYCQM